VADGSEDEFGGMAFAALEMVAAEVTVGLHASDHSPAALGSYLPHR
jgi:hypothetical protein